MPAPTAERQLRRPVGHTIAHRRWAADGVAAGADAIHRPRTGDGVPQRLHIAQDPESRPDQQTRAEAELNQIPGWLWDTIADPVLQRFGLTEPPRDVKTRIQKTRVEMTDRRSPRFQG
jgi:hypothetical protein